MVIPRPPSPPSLSAGAYVGRRKTDSRVTANSQVTPGQVQCGWGTGGATLGGQGVAEL